MLSIVIQFIKLLGGLGMFLFGMNSMSTGLERAAGNKLQQIMERITGNLFKSVLFGAVVAGLTQSSSATTVMVVGFVNAGIMSLTQAAGVIMGANIGTTITAWLLSLNDISGNGILIFLKPSTIAPIALVIGAFLLFFCKDKKKAVVGEIITGFGVLFIGMEYMSDAMAEVFVAVPALGEVFAKEMNPLLGILAGTGITALIQSSAASIGMLQAIATSGNLAFCTAFPIIMGQNIGTCVTALLACIGTSHNAKRTAMIHLYFNIIGTILFTVVIYSVHYLIGIPFWNNYIGAAEISIFHTCFNVTATIILLPFIKGLIWLANKTIRDKDGEGTQPFALLSDRFLATPPIAISNAKKAMVNMCSVAAENVALSRRMLMTKDLSCSSKFLENEELLDEYEIRLSAYLTQIADLPLSNDDTEKVAGYLRMVTNIERIGDYCDNIRESIERMVEKKAKFTDKAKKCLDVFFGATEDITRLTFEAFDKCDSALTRRIEPLEEVIDSLQEQLESEHIKRLKSKECNVEAGVSFLEILSNAERISDHCSNIGVAILQAQHDSNVDNRHQYLREIHAEMPGTYREDFESFKEQYSI